MQTTLFTICQASLSFVLLIFDSEMHLQRSTLLHRFGSPNGHTIILLGAIFKNWSAIYVSVGSISIGVCTCIVKVTLNNSSMYVNITIKHHNPDINS